MIPIFSLWILLFVNQLAADQCIKSDPCKCTFENGYCYDLHLIGDKSDSFVANGNTSGIQYLFHPCSDVTGENVTDCNSGYGVCLYNASTRTFTLLASLDCNSGYGVCLYNASTRTFTLLASNKKDATIKANSDSSNLKFFSKEACMKEIFIVSTLSTGAVLNITFLILVFTYLTVGISVDYFLMGARGVEVIPHLAFWKDFRLLVRDGIKFVQNGCKIQPIGKSRHLHVDIKMEQWFYK